MKNIFIMVGIPGSGKSTWVKEQYLKLDDGFMVLNADGIRSELYGDESIQGNPKVVFQILHDRLRKALLNDKIKTIFIDNTSVDSKSRSQIFRIIEHNCPECNINIKVFDDFDKSKEWNKSRDRVVPDDVMDRMIKKFEYPKQNETTLKFNII